jgi:nucleotide-binding universal stress UspA family protein
MKTILTPTDFSPNAINAIAYAAQLASEVRGKLILVHALPLPTGTAPAEGGVINPQVALKEAYLHELEKMSKTLRLENGFRFEVEMFCEEGPLYQCLGKLAVQQKVDMIVMGTKGATGFLQKLVGTNALTIMQQVHCPVLVVPATAKYTGLQKVAYASDFEKEEQVFLQQLFALVAPFQPEIDVLNVQAEEQLNIVADGQIIQEIAAQHTNLTVQVKQVKAASVLGGIKQYTRENPVQLLAVAIEKRNWFEAIFHHSVSAQLAFGSNLPLLALPQTPYKLAKNTMIKAQAATV